MNYKQSFNIIFFLTILFGYTSEISGQKGWELGGWLGTSLYNGDLNTEINLRNPGLALGIISRYNFNSRICYKASLNYGRVGADDSKSSNNFERNRNLSFRSNIYDFSQVIEFNFLEYIHGSRFKYFTPYLSGGLNMFYFNPTAKLGDTTYKLRNLGTEGQANGKEYNLLSFGIILGVGVKWDINYHYSLNIELSTRSLFTDYLDDVSTIYPNKAVLAAQRGEVAVALSDRSLVEGLGEFNRQRGDTKNKDNYTFFGLSFLRYFGRIDCPEISKIR